MNSDRGMYIALGVAIVALVIALWAVWDARSAMDRADAMAARLDPIETARTDEAGRIEALQAEVEELAQRMSELEAAAQQAPAMEPPSEQPPAEQPAAEPASEEPETVPAE